MIHAVRNDSVLEWDEFIPCVLFAYGEVPVVGLGFSSFDLLFGRQLTSPLSLLKDQSFKRSDTVDHVKKVHVSQFVIALREKIRFSIDAATKLYAPQQIKIKNYYDRKAVNFEFVPDQLVLVWLPRDGKPLSAACDGPYKKIRKIGALDYLISTPDKKLTRSCHVDLLKPYDERGILVASDVPHNLLQTVEIAVKTPCSVEEQITENAKHLGKDQAQKLKALILHDEQVFSDKPGKTDLLKQS